LAVHYNCALVAVERNGPGGTVLAFMGDNEKYPNLFLREGRLGYPTTSNTRPALVDTLAAGFASAPAMFTSPRLLREMRSFVRQKDGRPSAAAGAHDDCVMAMAVALKAREESSGSSGTSSRLEVSSLVRG
jgi:hypothetical protein